MYVTRPLSLYRKDPEALSLPPPEGPNSGILVIQDEESQPTCCFGLFYSDRVKDLPFPQNKNLRVRYVSGSGEHQHVHINRVVFIPVLNQPLSSNLYYVMERRGKYKGKAYTNSKEEEIETCCFCSCIPDIEPDSLDPNDIYQQFQICKRDWGGYVAKSTASDGFPPRFLRRKGWRVVTSTIHEFELNEAPGLYSNLRARLPDFYFPVSQQCSNPVVVGKWYSPFMYIKEGSLKDQINQSRYYEITLEQRWERVFASENTGKEGNAVNVDVAVETQVVAVAGREVAIDERNTFEGAMWFRSLSNEGREVSVGLSLAVIERMKWEEERVGWVGGNVNMKRVEEFEGKSEWGKFGCYMLVERFVVKRINGSVVMTWDFKHTNQIRTKWE